LEKLAEATFINFNLFAQLVPVNVVGEFLQLKGRYHEIFRSEVFIGNRVCLGRDSTIMLKHIQCFQIYHHPKPF